MSTSLLKKQQQQYEQKKNLVQQQQQQQRKSSSKVVVDINDEDENEKFIQLFPKCKPRLSSSPSERRRSSTSSSSSSSTTLTTTNTRTKKSMDCNANANTSISTNTSTCSIKSTCPKQFNKNNVNSFTSTKSDLNKTPTKTTTTRSVPKTYPGSSVRQIKSENCVNNKHKGQREREDNRSNSNTRRSTSSRRMDVSSSSSTSTNTNNMPDSFGRLYANSAGAGGGGGGGEESPPSAADLDMEQNSSSGSTNSTPNMQNPMFLRDSRIEIAGGRELYSHSSRNKTGRRIREHQVRTVPGPQHQHQHQHQHQQPRAAEETDVSGELEKEDRTDEFTLKQNNESTTSHVNQSLIRECQAQAYNPTQKQQQRGHLNEARSRHSFSGYGYSPFTPPAASSSEVVTNDLMMTKTKSNNRAIGGIARRSRTAAEFPPMSSFPNTHATVPLTLKETVFGSEITSIDKSISGNVGMTTTTDKTKAAPVGSSMLVASDIAESDKPYIYKTPMGTSCGDGEIVFDDIDEYELDERHYSSDTSTLQSSSSVSRPVITKDDQQQHQQHSSHEESGSVGGSGKSKRGNDDNNTSPSGYESDECSLPSSYKVVVKSSSSPNGNKRLIGTLPIADYERSPKRYGLNSSRSMDNNSDPTFRKQQQQQHQQQQQRVPSPNNLVPKMPGFPQRVTRHDVDPSSSVAGTMTVQLESCMQQPHNLPVTATSPSSSLEPSISRREITSQPTATASIPSNLDNLVDRLSIKSNDDLMANPVTNTLSCLHSEPHCSNSFTSQSLSSPPQDNLPTKSLSSIPPQTCESTDPYLYEFSETKKVLEEFFKGGGAVGASYNTITSNEIDYVLRRQAGNSYVGQRLAGDVSLVEESPKLPPRRGGREVVMSLDLNPKNPCAGGNGSSLRLITFHEVSRSSNSPVSGSQQGDVNGRDVNDNDIETGSTNTETDLGDTEIGLQVGRTRNFTLSPETTDCDSNELESEMSLDYEASVHSSTKVGGTMPILEDGLSSGNVSENEDENNSRTTKTIGGLKSVIATGTVTKAPPNIPSSNILGPQNFDSTSNPTVLLMKKQISEIEKEIRLRATQQHQQNSVVEPCDMGTTAAPQLPQLSDTTVSSKSSTVPGQIRVVESEESGAGRFDSNDPELEALDPMRRTPPPSPAPGSTVATDAISEILKSSSTHQTTAQHGGNISELPEYGGTNSSTVVSAALKDIKEAIQRTKHLHQNSHQVPQIDSSHSETTTTTFSSGQEARDRISSPVWVPRKSNAANLHRHERLVSRDGPAADAQLREPLLRKSRYEETGVDDVSDADTDQETDRLLGQNRTDDDYGFYDEKEKDGVKKKRSKEDLLKTPTVLIEGVLFRARYLGSTQLECEGQPTKATRMIQAEEAVSRIKPPEEPTENGEKSESQPATQLSSSTSEIASNGGGSGGLVPGSNNQKRTEEPCIGCEYEDYLYALGGDESEDDSYEEYYGRKSHVNRLGLKFIDNNKKVDTRYTSLPLQDPHNNSSTSSSSSSNAAARAQRAGSCGNISLTKVTSPIIGSSSSPSSVMMNKSKNLQQQQQQQIPIPFHLSPPCGSALPGTMFHLRFVGSLEVEEETGIGKKRRKRPKKLMVEEAVTKLKAPEGETQPSTEVDLFISTEKIMVLNTDLKEIMMDHALRTISYIADIGDLVVLMARRRPIPTDTPDDANKIPRPPKMICHVFESDEAQYIAQSIGQAFQVAYMEFLKANGIEDHSFVREMDYQEVLNSQEIFGDELQMFAKKELQKDVVVPKTKGEILGVVIVESGWGSMLPTVVIANLAPGNPAARCGQLNIGDQIIGINGVSLVGLPLSTCQNYIKNSKTQNVVKLTVVPCPPVVEVKIKRPDTKYQLGFSVQNGVICSLLRGGIAERGGVRVGHRIIEINNQSVVAVPHEKIVNLLATSVGEINMKTMPTSMFRLLTGQETPLYI